MPSSPLFHFNEEVSFWEANPQFKVTPPFKDLYDKDRTKKKNKSSTIMWAISYLKDPKSIMANAPQEDREKSLNEGLLKGKDIDIRAYQHLIDAYEEVCLTPMERSLEKFYDKLRERDEFLNRQNYTLEPISEKSQKTIAEQLDTMMGNTHKLYKQYKDIKEDLEKENAAHEQGKGGSKPSESDQGEI